MSRSVGGRNSSTFSTFLDPAAVASSSASASLFATSSSPMSSIIIFSTGLTFLPVVLAMAPTISFSFSLEAALIASAWDSVRPAPLFFYLGFP